MYQLVVLTEHVKLRCVLSRQSNRNRSDSIQKPLLRTMTKGLMCISEIDQGRTSFLYNLSVLLKSWFSMNVSVSSILTECLSFQLNCPLQYRSRIPFPDAKGRHSAPILLIVSLRLCHKKRRTRSSVCKWELSIRI